MQHFFDTNYPEIYLKECNQLNIGEIEKFENDYNISKHNLSNKPNSLKFDVHSDSNKKITGLSLKQNTTYFKITYIVTQLVSHQIELNKLVSIKPVDKIDMCIIEWIYFRINILIII